MRYPNPDTRLRTEYGSVRVALAYCVALGFNKSQAADYLGVDRATLRERSEQLNIEFRNSTRGKK